MGYLVLARKYRPQVFADMTGQEHVVRTLSNALTSGRVAHALLFCGPRGCGKTTTARIVAKALNCEKGPTPEPCGRCTPCLEIAAGTDVDVQEIDAASNTGVDNVRDLRESAKYLPARDRFKIFIVDEVHMLSKAAFNAFLKTLEEPPGHVKFLFATTDPQALPDTILSRCQRHNFRLVPLKQISERIRAIAQAEQVTIDDGAVALVARQAAGSMRDSLSILDQLFSSVGVGVPITAELAAEALGALDRGVVSDIAGALLARDARGVLAGVARAHDGGHDLKRLTEDLATHLRNLLAATVAGAPLDLPDHEVRLLREQAQGADPAGVSRAFELVHGALFEMSRAAQPRHALEVALLRAVYLAPSTSVQALLSRADELVRRLGGTPPGGGSPSGGPGGGSPSGGPGGRPRPSFDSGSPAVASRPPEPVTTASAMSAAPVATAAPVPSAGAPGSLVTAAASHPQPVVAPEPAVPAPVRPATWAPPVAAASPERPVPSVAPAVVAPSAAPAAPAKGADRRPWDRHLSVVSNAGPEAERGAWPAMPPAAPPPVTTEPAASNAAPAGALPADPVGAWVEWVEGVRHKRRALASLLEHARPLSFDGGVLSLGFVKGDFHARGLATETPALESLLSELAGRVVKLRVVELNEQSAAAVLSIAESADRAEREAREARMKLGWSHPEIVEAAAALQAEIEDVRDLGGVAS